MEIKEKHGRTIWAIGTSSGLGQAAACAFAQGGWTVIAGARSYGRAYTEENRASATQNASITKLPLDVTDEQSCEAFASAALKLSPTVDALLYGAAVLVLGSCERTSAEELNRVMQTNIIGAARILRFALPEIRKSGDGRVILFSSINGLLGIPFQGAYTASKHALEGYAECLAIETAPYGVQVCLVEPGDHRGGSQHTRLHAAAEDEVSPYREKYKSACTVIARDEMDGLLPERLGRKIVRNAERRRMRFRLCVAKPDQHLAVLMHKLLPFRLNAGILRGYYGGGHHE